MPKLENFKSRIELDGISYPKNTINYEISGSTVSIYYINQPTVVLRNLVARFNNWTDAKDNPYPSVKTLTNDLKRFLFSHISEIIPKSAFGELLVSELTPLFQGSFEYTVDNTELTTNTEQYDGTVEQADGMAVLSTSATIQGHAHLGSRAQVRYRAGLGGVLRFTVLFETPGVDEAEMYVGIVDALGMVNYDSTFFNGYTIGYNGMFLGVQRWSGGELVEEVRQEDWDNPLDGVDSTMTLDPTKLNVFYIQYQYLGAGAINFFVEDDESGIVVVFHSMKYANKNIVPSVLNPNFHFTLHVRNNSADNLVIKSSSYGYFVEGKTNISEIQQPEFSSLNREKTSVTTEVAIFTIRNRANYAGKTNFINIELLNISASIQASSTNNLGNVRLVRDAVLGGSPNYSDISINDSVVEIDTSGTTVGLGKELISIDLAGKNDRIFDNLTPFQIILQAGESVTLAASSANSATIDGSLLWKELF